MIARITETVALVFATLATLVLGGALISLFVLALTSIGAPA